MITFTKIPIDNIRLLITIQAIHICPKNPSKDNLNGNGLPKLRNNHIPVKITPIISILSIVHFAIIRSTFHHRISRSFVFSIMCYYVSDPVLIERFKASRQIFQHQNVNNGIGKRCKGSKRND